MTTDTRPPTALSRAARMHALAKRATLMEAKHLIDQAVEVLSEIEEMSATRKVLEHEQKKIQAVLSELPVYRPPERGQGEQVDEELAERVRVARAGEDTRGVEV